MRYFYTGSIIIPLDSAFKIIREANDPEYIKLSIHNLRYTICRDDTGNAGRYTDALAELLKTSHLVNWWEVSTMVEDGDA